MKTRTGVACALIAGLAVLLSGTGVGFCQWPTKQLNIVVPYGAGGTTDRVIRALGPFLEKELGVPMVLVNRPGGGGLVGAKAHLVNDPADGSFIVYNIQPYLSGAVIKGAFTLDDFDYLGLNYYSPQGLWVNTKAGKYKTAQDLLKAIQAQPGKIKMSVVPNSWSRPSAALITERLGAAVKEIPYEDGGKQRMAVLKEEVDFTVTEIHGTLAAAAEDMTCLAVFAKKPVPEVPHAPLISDVMKAIGKDALPAISNTRFFHVKTEFRKQYPERFEMLNKALENAFKNPEFVDIMKKQQLDVAWMTPAETKTEIHESHAVAQQFADFWK
ncbi:MAG: tripartite tricarboxylate transporter substrate binding protein [Desulfobacterales bacterium]|jgi:tripartite-type tricarboxylate transporter receptor subunit TctC|nr:tripartite tricarboxylate transporter substrate binding protein [Desulfobacterales bacterium]